MWRGGQGTFTLADQTVQRLLRMTVRLANPQSQVVREALQECEAHGSKLTDAEQLRMLGHPSVRFPHPAT